MFHRNIEMNEERTRKNRLIIRQHDRSPRFVSHYAAMNTMRKGKFPVKKNLYGQDAPAYPDK